MPLREDILDADGFEFIAQVDRLSRSGGIHVHLLTSMRCTHSFRKASVAAFRSDGAVHPADAGTFRENASAGPNACLTVAPALRAIGGV